MDLPIKLPLNRNAPTVMHIDLNSCFATVEQQANPLLRGRPIAVAAYTSPGGCILAPSIEAKRLGIKVGMTVRDGKLLCKDLVVLAPDPPKYRAVHLKMRRIFQEYSPNATPKSIDEVVIDFAGTPVFSQGLTKIAQEIKERLRKEIGEWMSCSIGIGTNRFLAKTAASLHKPDGLDVITHKNLEQIYRGLKLLDLCGINTRFEARLNAASIFTPKQFLDASLNTLQKEVFRSILGYHWYLRLRGWETDAIDFGRKSYGQSYALKGGSKDPIFLSQLIMKLTEKMGRRLRRAGYAAHGVHLAVIYSDYTHWHLGRLFPSPLYATSELYKKVIFLFNKQPRPQKIAKLAVSCYQLVRTHREQLGLFETDRDKNWRLSDALDKINNKYGEFVITPALMLGMDGLVLDRISFGGVGELED